MKYTKKYYEDTVNKLTKFVRPKVDSEDFKQICEDFSKEFKEDNENFKEVYFLKACEVQ